ncbi:GntR family transcriptional regulator [Arthrobacter crystallopoietes]|nr:GntR family transcriptional regulator [Arthrobacter crystallopoietes]
MEERPTAVLIANRLRNRIINGSFELGEQVTEAAIAAKLKVSRGPVREALQRLSQEGLLVGHRNRGVFVLELTPKDVHEIYVARRAVETAAAAEIIAAGDKTIKQTARKLTTLVRKLPDAVAARDWTKVAELDLKFHETLVAASGNSRLSRMFITLAAESRICMVHVKISYRRIDMLVEEHQQMIDLLVAKDAEGLHAAIVDHMETATVDLTESMEEMLRLQEADITAPDAEAEAPSPDGQTPSRDAETPAGAAAKPTAVSKRDAAAVPAPASA